MTQSKVERKQNVNKDERKQQIENQLVSGPQAERTCTDPLCCLLFVAYFIFMIYIGIRGFADGEPQRMVAVYDSSGLPCGMTTTVDGVDYNLEEYKYVYFAVPYPGELDRTYCVKECPAIDSDSDADTEYSDGIDCNTKLQPEDHSYDDTGKCVNQCDLSSESDRQDSFCIYNTEKFLGRVCFPGSDVLNTASNLSSSLSEAINMDKLSEYLDDLDKGKYIVLASLGIAFVIGLVYMLFVRVFAKIIVWIVILIYIALMAVLTYFCYNKYDEIKLYLEENDNVEQGDYTNDNKTLYLVLGIVFASILVLTILFIVCFFNSIRLAIAIIESATIFIRDVKSTLLVPIVMALALAAWWVIWVVTFMYVYSVGEIAKQNVNSIFANVTWTEQQKYFVWCFVFGGLWVNAFLQSLTQFVLASSASIWYFGQPDGNFHAPVTTSYYRAFKYHLGSLAFGSLILAIVQLVRLILEYVYKQQQKYVGTENKIIKGIFCYLRCCLYLFEKVVKFINKIAYIQMALSGDNFCKSCYFGMSQVFNNKAKYLFTAGLGACFVFVGKVFMIFTNVFICYTIYTKADPYKSEMNSTWLPLLIILLLTWGVATVFLSVYSMAINTILLCYLYDLKIHGNSKEKIRAPQPLKSFFEDHNQEIEKYEKEQAKQETAGNNQNQQVTAGAPAY